MGRNAFAHKGGMHVAGVTADPATFEHIEPEIVGNRREMLISELSGKGTVQSRAREAGIELDDAVAAHVVERVKDLEHRGYHYEAADGSFELLLRKETGDYEPLFTLESWRVIVEKRADGRVETEATIKIWHRPGGERYVRTAEGNGPVNALDRALREALVEIYPHLRDIELVNFKVRILDETKGTGAVTRVLLDASDGEQRLGLDRRLGERDRGLVGGARRLAGVRHAARAAGACRWRGRDAAELVTELVIGTERRADPARPAGPRARGGGAGARRCCAPAGCRWAPCRREFERAFAARVGAAHAGRRSRAGPPACTSRCGRSA